MEKGFSSKTTKEIYDSVVKYHLTGEQFHELANRLKEYGDQLIIENQRRLLEEMINRERETIYDLYF